MSGITIALLQQSCNNGNILWSTHALSRLQERGIFRKDIRYAILNGEIIEQYPKDFPHPSCLVLGTTLENQPLHVVCSCDGEYITIITAYYPTSDKFESDNKTRKGQQ